MEASGLELAGMLAGCGAAAIGLVASDQRLRLAALLVALAAAPALVAGDVWNEERVVRFREDAAMVGGTVILAGATVAALAALFRRLPAAFAVLCIALLPLRVPVEVGGETANLLVPLYVVIAAGLAARLWQEARGEPTFAAGVPSRGVTWWLRVALAATLVLYGLQTAYSKDVSNAIENAGFFLIPFAVMFALLAEIRWSRRLLAQALVAAGAMAAVFAAIAVYQYVVRDIWLNPGLEDSNQLHLYYRVNSAFFDPNILGRYLALAMIALAGYLAYGRDRRWLALTAATCALLLAGLAFSFSITSFATALAGLGALALLRWRWHAVAAVAAAGALALGGFLAAGGAPSSEIDGDRGIDSGRENLISAGVDLAADRPLAGWGSGAFGVAYFQETPDAKRGAAVISHAEPVTVAAEQGALGLAVYIALLGLALATLLGGSVLGSPARAAVAAAFVAMVVHSFGYAGFVTDPATWALLALGVALRDDRVAG